MKTIAEDMRDLGCDGRMVMDRGFESADNVSALLDLGVRFTMPSNAKAEPIKKLMSRAVSEFKESSSYAYHEGRAYKYAEYEVGVCRKDGGGHEYVIQVPSNHKHSTAVNARFSVSRTLKASVVFDSRKASDDINSMMSMVSETELRLENSKHRDPDAVYTHIEDPGPKCGLFFLMDD